MVDLYSIVFYIKLTWVSEPKETDEKLVSLPSSQQSFWPRLANSSHRCFLLQFQQLAPWDHPMRAYVCKLVVRVKDYEDNKLI